MGDIRGTVTRHFYPSQPESYQGSYGGDRDPKFTHSNNEHNLPEVSMEAEQGTWHNEAAHTPLFSAGMVSNQPS